MAKKPILTDEELDGGLPMGSAGPPPLPSRHGSSVTRPVDAPAPPSVTRPLDAPMPPPLPEASGRDASGHARPKTRIHAHVPAPNVAAEAVPQIIPVVGWLVVTKGPGRGSTMGLIAGMNAIGRGEENHVQVDFGDDAISRDAHAYITYDSEARQFHLSHSGKTNLVRLNDAPVLAVEGLAHGDTVRIGSTTLRFVALCGADFDWGQP